MSQSEQSSVAPVVRQSDIEGAPRPVRPPRNVRQPADDVRQVPDRKGSDKSADTSGAQRRQLEDTASRDPGRKTARDSKQEDGAPKKVSLRELFSSQGISDDPDAALTDIAGAVKRLGMKDEEFDELEITIGEGAEPMKFKDLKENVGKLVDLETRELRFERRRVQQEGEILRGQQELRELMALMPASAMTPNLVNKVRQAHDTKVNRERELTIEHIPEWRRESVMSEDLKGMEEYAAGYGFPKGWLGTISDHRVFKMLRDNYLLNKKIDAALAEVEIPDDKNLNPSGKSKSAARPTLDTGRNRRAGVRPTQRDKLMNMFTKE